MTLRFLDTGSFRSNGYRFDSNNPAYIEQLVVDEVGEYLLKTFPKKFEKVEFDPPKEVPIVVEVETTPVTKAQVKRSEPKKKRGRSSKPKTEEDDSVKKK